MQTAYFSITVTLSCVMKLEKYPFDNQTCGIQMGSCKFIVTLNASHWAYEVCVRIRVRVRVRVRAFVCVCE